MGVGATFTGGAVVRVAMCVGGAVVRGGTKVGVIGGANDQSGEDVCFVEIVPRGTSTGLAGGCDVVIGGASVVTAVVFAPKVTVLSLCCVVGGVRVCLGEPRTIVDHVNDGGRCDVIGGAGGCLIC